MGNRSPTAGRVGRSGQKAKGKSECIGTSRGGLERRVVGLSHSQAKAGIETPLGLITKFAS